MPDPRYYAYNPTMGRRLIPADDFDDDSAIAWAISHGYDNVVLETGPYDKPTKVALVWEKNSPHPAAAPTTAYHNALFDVLAQHFPTATIFKLQEAMRDIERIKES